MRIAFLFLFFCSLSLITTSCSKKSSERALVRIDLNEIQTYSSSVSNTASPGLPEADIDPGGGANWGLEDPTSLSDLDCFGIFVGGPEKKLQSSRCENSAGENIAKFGIIAGLFEKGQSAEIFVPAGKGRLFYLFGMSSGDGTCNEILAEGQELNNSNYSNPFLIGSAEKDLASAEENIYIELDDSFSSGNKVEDCNFFGTHISVTYPEPKRSTFVNDEVDLRTVTFNHNGDYVRCSSDGGATFSSCTSSDTFVWNQANASVKHHIRVYDNDGSYEEETFTPDQLYPNLNFVTCTHTINSDTNFDDWILQNALGNNNSTLCLKDGVTIGPGSTNTSLSISGRSNITIIAGHGDVATLDQTGDDLLLAISNSTDIKIVGVKLQSAATSTLNHAVSIHINSENVQIENSHIELTGGSDNRSVYINNSGTTTPIQISHSKIENSAAGTSIGVMYNSVLNLNESYVSSNALTFLTGSGSQVEVNKSIIVTQGSSASHHVFKLSTSGTDAHMAVNDSLIFDGSGGGIGVTGGASTGDAHLELNNNSFVRLDSNTGTSNAAIRLNITANLGLKYLNSSDNGNYFCSQDSTQVAFAAMVSGTLAAGSTWNDADQLNSGGVNVTCPTDIQDKISELGL